MGGDKVVEVRRLLDLLAREDWVQIPYGGDNPVQFKIYEISVALNVYGRDGSREMSRSLLANKDELNETVRGFIQYAA